MSEVDIQKRFQLRTNKMAIDQSLSRIQPRLVRVEDCATTADIAGPPNAVPRLMPVQIVKNERSIVARSTSDAVEPMPSMGDSGGDDSPADSRSYLQTLEMISSAARTMATIEDESQRIRANAFALTQRVRSERIEADQQIGVLKEQLKVSHYMAEQLKQQLAEAEERANVAEAKANNSLIEQLEEQLVQAEERANAAEEWLERFQEAIVSSFSARRAAETGAPS